MLTKKDKQGSKANKTGKELENRVESYLRDNFGVFSINYRDWKNDAKEIPHNTKRLLLKNVPYTNIYGGNSYGEFVLSSDGKEDTRIECRLQNVSGSVDEKLPYLFENSVAFEEKNVILVVEGDGFKKGAKEWLKAKTNSIKYKNIKVLSLKEFEKEAVNIL